MMDFLKMYLSSSGANNIWLMPGTKLDFFHMWENTHKADGRYINIHKRVSFSRNQHKIEYWKSNAVSSSYGQMRKYLCQYKFHGFKTVLLLSGMKSEGRNCIGEPSALDERQHPCRPSNLAETFIQHLIPILTVKVPTANCLLPSNCIKPLN